MTRTMQLIDPGTYDAEGQLAMLFLPPQTPFPNDGIRWLETEATQFMNAGGGRVSQVNGLYSL